MRRASIGVSISGTRGFLSRSARCFGANSPGATVALGKEPPTVRPRTSREGCPGDRRSDGFDPFSLPTALGYLLQLI